MRKDSEKKKKRPRQLAFDFVTLCPASGTSVSKAVCDSGHAELVTAMCPYWAVSVSWTQLFLTDIPCHGFGISNILVMSLS